jgi:cbb3-type cytochrome oxidase subunit 3
MNFLKSNALTLIGLLIAIVFWAFNRQEFNQLANEKFDLIRLMTQGQGRMDSINASIMASNAITADLSRKNGLLLVQNKDLRKHVHELQGLIQTHVVTVIDSVLMPVDSAEIIRTASGNSLKLPYFNTYRDKHISFRQEIDKEGRNVLRNITIQDSLTITTYTAKRKFDEIFKPRQTKVAIQSTNPHTHVRGIQSVVVSHRRKWFEKPIVWGLVGFTAGFAVTIIK